MDYRDNPADNPFWLMKWNELLRTVQLYERSIVHQEGEVTRLHRKAARSGVTPELLVGMPEAGKSLERAKAGRMKAEEALHAFVHNSFAAVQKNLVVRGFEEKEEVAP